MSRGRHARPSRAFKAAGTAAMAGTTAAAATVGFSGHASAAVIIPSHTVRSSVVTVHAEQVNRHVIRQKPAYTVRAGDYLSGISAAECSTAADWTGIYDRNRKTIGNDPNLILPGQQLILDCRQGQVYVPPAPVRAQVQAPASQDSDDAASQSSPSQPPQTVTHVTYQGGSDPSGQLTRDQVGELWIEAGGPAWAEYAAENVAYCESGFNTFAYNPSGASGLWQILGEVVPGNVFDARVNAENAVSKFEASGNTWAQWVCKP